MPVNSAVPYIASQGDDIRLHRTIAIPAMIYIGKHNLDDTTGNAIPSTGTLNNNPASDTDANLFAAIGSAVTSISESGLMASQVSFAAPATFGNYASLPDHDGHCVGLTSGGVRLRKEQDTVQHQSDQLRGVYDEDAHTNRWSLDTALDEMTMWNLALSWGRDMAAIGSSSFILLKAADQEFHSMRIMTKCPNLSFTNSTGAFRRGLRNIQFFKVKAWMNGDIAMTREDKQTIPVMFTCYCDGNENWGVMWDSFNPIGDRITAPLYNTLPNSAA